MTSRKNTRYGALWGYAFIAFFAAAVAILFAAGEHGDSPQQVISWYEGHGELELAGYLVGAAGFCLLPFLGALRAIVGRAEGERDQLSSLAFGAGLVFTVMIFLSGAALAGVATAANWDNDYRIDATTSSTVEQLGFFFWNYAGVAGGVLAGAASIVAWRTRVLPRWLAIVGFVTAGAGFVQAATWGFGTVAVLIWILLTSTVMLGAFARARGAAPRSRRLELGARPDPGAGP